MQARINRLAKRIIRAGSFRFELLPATFVAMTLLFCSGGLAGSAEARETAKQETIKSESNKQEPVKQEPLKQDNSDTSLLLLTPDQDDTLFRALIDEMKRAEAKLELGTHDKPYFLQYKVLDSTTYSISASYGSISGDRLSRARRLYSDVRVGDYDLDSSKESTSLNSLFGVKAVSGGRRISVEDDYDAIRHEVWLATDSAYKKAIESYEAKKAKLKAKPENDRLADLSKARPVLFIKPRVQLEIDREKWKSTVRQLSSLFLKYPQIENSVVSLSSTAGNAWLVNNEGFKHRDGRVQTMLTIMARIKSKDGRTYADTEFLAADSADELPDKKVLEKRVLALVDRLERVAGAVSAESYSGPVLFQPQAAGALFYTIFSRTMGGAHESSGGLFQTQHPFKNKLGQRVASRVLNVSDDPGMTEFEGVKLFGNFEVDDDGVPSQKLSLIEQGILKTFCTSRQPTRGVEGSNGHSADGVGSVSILMVSGSPSVSGKKMKKRLLQLGKEQGFEHVYLVKDMIRLPNWLLDPGSALSTMFSGLSGEISLYPTEIYKVDVKSGREVLVRGPHLQLQPARALKDIVSLGEDTIPVLMAHGQSTASSIISPSVIIRDVELREPSKEVAIPPVLQSPLEELVENESSQNNLGL